MDDHRGVFCPPHPPPHLCSRSLIVDKVNNYWQCGWHYHCIEWTFTFYPTSKLERERLTLYYDLRPRLCWWQIYQRRNTSSYLERPDAFTPQSIDINGSWVCSSTAPFSVCPWPWHLQWPGKKTSLQKLKEQDHAATGGPWLPQLKTTKVYVEAPGSWT